ncbi:hypothetical protein ABQJ54_03125 [Rhodanobacter sp. Si-c]|uniref:Uncharacterized protein n=1 Tax=Rhodanobacter lycopersici TaxID=3162487 RepID=A0ABV3QA70_9GAMM
MPKSRTLNATLLAAALLAAGSRASAQQTAALPDFNGLWRISDQGSDSPAQVTARLRAEIRREQSPTVAPAAASSSGNAPRSGNGAGGGRHGGGMGGGHMGGGGMGGGHGRGGGKHASTSSDDSSGDNDMLKSPPMLDNDSILVVQQDARAVQARLENGEQLDVRLDGNHQQTLDGSAVARRQAGGPDLQFSLEFGDGGRIEETWSRSADGRTLQVVEQWQPGFLQRPVVFRRVYQRVD